MKYQIGFEPQTLTEAHEAQYCWEMRRNCLEAYLKTVSPYQEEFDTVMQELLEVRDEFMRLGMCAACLGAREYYEQFCHARPAADD